MKIVEELVEEEYMERPRVDDGEEKRTGLAPPRVLHKYVTLPLWESLSAAYKESISLSI